MGVGIGATDRAAPAKQPAGAAAWSVTGQTLKDLAALHAMTVSAWGLCTP